MSDRHKQSDPKHGQKAVSDKGRKKAAAAGGLRSSRASESHDPTRIYLSEIGGSPLLSAEEEVYFARLAQQGDEAARQGMIESNLGLVVKIARRYMNRGLALLDLSTGRFFAERTADEQALAELTPLVYSEKSTRL